MTDYAYYLRVSTDKQESGENSQRESVIDWLDEHDVENYDEYVDLNRSGSDDTRKNFNQLLAAVQNDEYTDIVMPEISRMARKTSTAADFIDECVANGVTIHLLDDMIDSIKPDDPMSQFFAKLISLWMEEERKQTIRRINRGMQQAQREGKWTGGVPTGFTTDEDGYLMVDVEEYLAVRDALARAEDGESYRSVERDTRFTRQTLSNLLNDRGDWYSDAETHPTDAESDEEKRRREIAQEALEEADV